MEWKRKKEKKKRNDIKLLDFNYVTSEFSMTQSSDSGFFWPWPLDVNYVYLDK